MITSIISRLVIVIFGTLFPAYASYKAVKTKNLKEYVKWMMYWIVFAIFSSAEIFTDIFLSWFPFYYEIKILLVIWLLSPATKGSSILYRKFVHPMLSSREQEIDEYISKAKEQGYKQVIDISSKGVSVLMQTALKSGGGLVNQLKKSYSLGDLNDQVDADQDEIDVVSTRRLSRRKHSPIRSSNTSSKSSLYLSDRDLKDPLTQVQSLEDISSGYSSGEALSMVPSMKVLCREPISRAGSLTRSQSNRATRSTSSKKSSYTANNANELCENDIIYLNQNFGLNKLKGKISESSSEEEFLDTLDKLHDLPVFDIEANIDIKNYLTACNVIRSFSSPENLFKENNSSVYKLKCEQSEIENKTQKLRKGKYNKKAAPPPPNFKKDHVASTENMLSAKLVLQPGVLKATGSNKMFLSSPKLFKEARKIFCSGKMAGHPDTKMKYLGLDKPAIFKRFSWSHKNNEELSTLSQSKSDTDLLGSTFFSK